MTLDTKLWMFCFVFRDSFCGTFRTSNVFCEVRSLNLHFFLNLDFFFLHTSFLRVLPPKVNYCRITGNRKDVRWLFAKIEQFCAFMNLLCFTTMALYTKLSEPLNERIISDIINVCVLKIIAWFIITFSVILVWAGITIRSGSEVSASI